MTLRVTLEVVPLGDETKKYSIGYLDIHNLRTAPNRVAEYLAVQFSDVDKVRRLLEYLTRKTSYGQVPE